MTEGTGQKESTSAEEMGRAKTLRSGLGSASQAETILPRGGHLARSRDIFGYHTGAGWGGRRCYRNVVGRGRRYCETPYNT